MTKSLIMVTIIVGSAMIEELVIKPVFTVDITGKFLSRVVYRVFILGTGAAIWANI